jgi:hypothetical protein
MALWVVMGLTFLRNILSQCSGLKSGPSKKPLEAGSKLKMDIVMYLNMSGCHQTLLVSSQKTVLLIVSTIRSSNKTFVLCVSE